MSWLRRLLNALRPGRVERDIAREVAFHIAERTDELRAAGLSEREAVRRARAQFGNPTLQAERTRDADVAAGLDALLRHLRYGVRTLSRTPGFTTAVVVTLALGIGANTVVFSALDAVLLRPLPFPDADRLVELQHARRHAREHRGTIPVQGLRVALLACLLGVTAALLFGRVLSGMLYGVSPTDVPTLASVVALVLAMTGLAALVPSTRAASVEPIDVLREQ